MARRRWLWYQRGAIAVAVAGGLIMLLMAAVAHDSASIPLLIIGGSWTAMGAAGRVQSRRVACELRIEDGAVTFVFAARELSVPAGDVIGLRQRWGPYTQRAGHLLIQTGSQGTVRAAPMLVGLFDFVTELRRVNPQVAVDL
jgi:hypothetical protein